MVSYRLKRMENQGKIKALRESEIILKQAANNRQLKIFSRF